MEPDDQDAPAFDEVRRRARMVEHQLEARGIADARVLDVMRRVQREQFVAVSLRRDAYADAPLPIGDGQTISQPYIVALMTESARVGPSDRVLEVGAGSGYASAVLSLLAARVYAIERHAGMCDAARTRLERLGHRNIELRCGDGSVGWPEAAPFDAILVAAGGPAIPVALCEQLADGDRLVMPVGYMPHHQQLVQVTRHGAAYRQGTLCSVNFVPLIGAHSWPK